MPAYIAMFWLRPKPGISRLEALMPTVKQTVRNTLTNGGIVRNVRNNGVRKMAYKFKGRGEGERHSEMQMFTLEVFAPPEFKKNLVQSLKMNEDLLRMEVFKAEGTLPSIKKMLKTGAFE
mmetsp:Transcript_12013/g.19549  ORF Transcript_12013/g.19549 Transcript_12013/m.19549 type:complete len:120 (-) Transcript_12013:65-424(-)